MTDDLIPVLVAGSGKRKVIVKAKKSKMEELNKLITEAGKLKCATCGKAGAIAPRVPWGMQECPACREKTGYCLICHANRNDCCC